ncbi:MAG: hypothetical protein AAFO15_01435 [Pseudomonadota bacterium]
MSDFIIFNGRHIMPFIKKPDAQFAKTPDTTPDTNNFIKSNDKPPIESFFDPLFPQADPLFPQSDLLFLEPELEPNLI